MQASAVAHSPHARPVAISRKLVLSAFGVIPLGAYVFLHLWTNLSSLQGADAFNAALVQSRNHPGFLVIEVLGLGVPLLVHAGLGMREIFRGRPNFASYPFFNNLKFLLQRLSAIGLFFFIGAHVWNARISPSYVSCQNPPQCSETWLGMHYALSEWPTMIVYVLGLLGVSYHLANGLQTAAVRVGLVVSPTAQARMQVLSMAVLALLLIMSGAAIYGFQPFSAPFPPA